MKSYINIPYSELKIKKVSKYIDCQMCGICIYNNKLYSFKIIDDFHNGDKHSLNEKHANLKKLNFLSKIIFLLNTKLNLLIHFV
jgi:hypothetical protein